MCCCTVDLSSLARQSDAFSTSVICYAHSQPTFLATCQNMQIPAGCGSATAKYVIVSQRDLLHERRDEWLWLILLKVLQTQSSPCCSPASRRSKSAYSALCLQHQSASMELSKSGSLEPAIDSLLALRHYVSPLRFRPKPRHSGGKALIPQKPCPAIDASSNYSAAEVSIPIKYESQDSQPHSYGHQTFQTHSLETL